WGRHSTSTAATCTGATNTSAGPAATHVKRCQRRRDFGGRRSHMVCGTWLLRRLAVFTSILSGFGANCTAEWHHSSISTGICHYSLPAYHEGTRRERAKFAGVLTGGELLCDGVSVGWCCSGRCCPVGFWMPIRRR